jgi:hypothetical protein
MPGIFHNSAAFVPFFDCVISVEGLRASSSSGSAAPTLAAATAARKVSGTFKACVFDNGFADPFAAADADSNVRTFSISVRAGDWIERTPPQIGDRITIHEEMEVPEGALCPKSHALTVSRVDSVTGDIWSFRAKEVE